MKEKIKIIIESYCQGIEWLEFNIADLDKMAEEIQALQLLQTDVIKSVCENCERKQLYIKKQCYCGFCGDRLKK